MEWDSEEVLDSGDILLPGPTSGGEEEVFPVAGLTEVFIHQQPLDGQQEHLKLRSTF
jgi:hypothetical protein